MSYTLKLEPHHSTYYDIITAFNSGKPLTPGQLNFLRSYHVKLSDPAFDAILKYYDVSGHKENLLLGTVTREKLHRLKDRILGSVKIGKDRFGVVMSTQQFFQLKTLLAHEIIFFHGNQLLTGAPYFAGGVPHIDFLQWGNLFGIVKYEELLGENAIDGNIMIYFEDMADRTLSECIEAINHQIHITPKVNLQPPVVQEPEIILQQRYEVKK
jgi:hypothetical protein